MKRRITGYISIVCSFVITSSGLGDENYAVGSATFAAACEIVFRDSEVNKVRIFATVSTKSIIKDINGFSVELIVNEDIIKNHRKYSPAYHNHHNLIVLRFAAAQVINGDRDLGSNLIQLLSIADPYFEGSSPIHGNKTIQQILKELNDESTSDFLEGEKNQWNYLEKEYSTPNQKLEPTVKTPVD